jgi:DNA-directed RNA polymerase specialized sigma24 family protein
METLVERTLQRSLDGRERDDVSPRDFQSSLRREILDNLEDELRLRQTPAEEESSALETAVDRRSYERYESSLQKLTDEDREAVIARIELDFPYSKIARILGKPSPEEARATVIRALLKLAEQMESST